MEISDIRTTFVESNKQNPYVMKNIVLGLFVLVWLSSCSKDGHVYRACYTTPNGWLNQNQTQKSVVTSFFFRDEKDSIAALNWYKQTEVWKDVSTKCDSFWVEYWGTVEEWKEVQ